MNLRTLRTFFSVIVLLTSSLAFGQAATGTQLAELISLKSKVSDPDTRTRVTAFHRVWQIALSSDNSEVKTTALGLMAEPVASASDHIRMPAVYAIQDVANSTDDLQVKLKALSILREPMIASQLPIRLAAIDGINDMTRVSRAGDFTVAAVAMLGEPIRSGNNGVRIPAINAVMMAVHGCNDNRAYTKALDLMTAPLDSMAMIGGMEVRMMAVVAVERIGTEATDIGIKAKAMGMLQAYAAKDQWEPEARKFASEAASRIQASMK